MLTFCTLFDKQHVAEARLCCSSIHVHAQQAMVYTLCLDEEALEAAGEWPVVAIPLRNMEERYPGLAAVRGDRDWPSYTQTCKVFLPSFVFEVFGAWTLCYVDSDMLFWSDPQAISLELGTNSFMVTSREDPVRPLQGAFNGGFFVCHDDLRSKQFMAWWQQKVLDWCKWEPGPGGRYTEEGYLNVIADEPDRFPGTTICRHPGVNLARWNANRHKLEVVDGGVMIDDKWPLVCFHYQSFENTPPRYGLGAEPEGALRYVYEQYAGMLEA